MKPPQGFFEPTRVNSSGQWTVDGRTMKTKTSKTTYEVQLADLDTKEAQS